MLGASSCLERELDLIVRAAAAAVSVTDAGDLIENEPITHTDVDRALFDKFPLESQSPSLSSPVTLGAPGITAERAPGWR